MLVYSLSGTNDATVAWGVYKRSRKSCLSKKDVYIGETEQ